MALVLRGAHRSPLAGPPTWSRPGAPVRRVAPVQPVDVRIEGGTIVEVAPRVVVCPDDEVIDATGAYVVPGLHDHHLHLRAAAAARDSVDAGPGAVADLGALGERLRRAAAAAVAGARTAAPSGAAPSGADLGSGTAGGSGASGSGADGGPDRVPWVRAVGYHESLGGELDRWTLDRLCDAVPVRVQHASGILWVVNSAGVAALDLDRRGPPGVERDAAGRATGRIRREDRWLAGRLPPRDDAELAAVSREAAARGVTGFTDATPGRDGAGVAALAALVDGGALLQRLHLMADPGAGAGGHPLVTVGPVKVLLDDADLPTLDDLSAAAAAAHADGRPVAVHCVTAVQAALAVAALEAAGTVAGDRIEHGAVVPPGLVPRLVRLGLTVVTQPGMAAARGDRYRAEVEPRDLPDLWRLGSLLAAGVDVALGTDAPYGPADPWTVVAAAVHRQTPSGAVLGAGERIGPLTALGLFTGRPELPGRPRRVAAGEPADLCLVEVDGLARFLAGMGSEPPAVRCTVVAGRVVHPAGGPGSAGESGPGGGRE